MTLEQKIKAQMIKEDNEKPYFQNKLRTFPWRTHTKNRFVRAMAGRIFASCITNQERISFQNKFFNFKESVYQNVSKHRKMGRRYEQTNNRGRNVDGQ